MERYKALLQLVITLEDDFRKFYDKGNKAAGTRVRGGMQRVKTLAQEIRTDVQDIKNSEA